jgi:hypothetical protein
VSVPAGVNDFYQMTIPGATTIRISCSCGATLSELKKMPNLQL